jgi:RNA polymerase sigma-70 factor (ECF subfamily)
MESDLCATIGEIWRVDGIDAGTVDGDDPRGEGSIMSKTEMPSESQNERDFDEIIGRVRSGHPEAIAELWRLYNPRLVRYLRVILDQDWEDVASETWIGVARSLQRFSGGVQGFEALLFTVARRRVVDHLRRLGARPSTVSIVGFEEQREHGAGPEDVVVAESSLAEVMALLRQLPRAQAEIVYLRTISGLDVAEIAEIVGKTPGSVRVLSHRGIVRLHSLIAASSAVESEDDLPVGSPAR